VRSKLLAIQSCGVPASRRAREITAEHELESRVKLKYGRPLNSVGLLLVRQRTFGFYNSKAIV